MTKHYIVRNGYTVYDHDGTVLGEGGDIISLDTDSSNRAEALAAEGLLRRAGGANAVCLVSSAPAGKGKKSKKKKGAYKTREMAAEPDPEPEAEPEVEEPEAEAPEEDEAG